MRRWSPGDPSFLPKRRRQTRLSFPRWAPVSSSALRTPVAGISFVSDASGNVCKENKMHKIELVSRLFWKRLLI